MALNLILFQTLWLVCVVGAAYGWPWLGVAAVAVRVGLGWRELDAKLLLSAAVIGFVGEWLLVTLGAIDYAPRARTAGTLVPAWMIALWVNFATTLHSSLAWLQGRYVAATMAGAIAAPFSYWAGRRLGAIVLNPEPVYWICGIGLLWAVATPVLVWISEAAAA